MSKRLQIYEDPSLPTGMAVLVINPPPGSEDGLSVVIDRRNSDRPYLGPHGWQAAEYGLIPITTRVGTDGLELIFGSEVTRNIDVAMDLIISIPTHNIRERIFWPEITPAPEEKNSLNLTWQNGRTLGVGKSGSLVDSGPQPMAETQPAVLELAPVEGEAGAASVPTPNRRRWILLAIIVPILLLLAGLGVWYILNKSNPPLVHPPAVQESTAPTPPQPSFADRYKVFLGQSGHADDLLALGNEALAGGENETGFNAVTLSADRGSAAAKLLIAQWYDPLSAERKLITANPNNAARYYRDAADLGLADAKTALKRLCDTAAADTRPAPDWIADFDKNTYCQ